MILNYFGEDTSALEIRSDCCDNCANGLSSWRISDLYYRVSDDGTYDCAKDAGILFAAIKEMKSKKIKTEKNKVVNVLNGVGYQNLASHGAGSTRKPYFWVAFIDQLLSADYLEFVSGEIGLMLSHKAEEWLQEPSSPLQIKAAGAIWSYLKRKPSTPITDTRWKRNHTSVTTGHAYSYHSNIIELMFGPCVFCD